MSRELALNAALALPIFLMTITLALTRPRLGPIRIDHAMAAVLGAGFTLLTGAVSLETASEAIASLARPLAAIVSLMVLNLLAEDAGLFDRLAAHVARAGQGDGRKLFRYLFVAGTIVGAVFTNDAAVLIFTPLVYKLIRDLKDDSWSNANEIPYYFAVLYVANLVGLFVVSNPINLIVASIFDIKFMEYARWMALPAVVSMVVSYTGLRVVFRKSLPARYRSDRVSPPADGRGWFLLVAGGVLAATLVGFFLERLIRVPTWGVAVIGASVLLFCAHAARWTDVHSVIRRVGWDVIIFVAGIFVVVQGLRNTGLTHYVEEFVVYLAQGSMLTLIVTNGLVTSICSALMNNHSTAYVVALAIEDLPSGWAAGFGNAWFARRMLVLSALIGGDLGPKMLPIGSLAALLWFRMLRERGVHIPYTLYIKIGVPMTVAAVVASTLALYLEYLIVRAPR